MDPRIPRLDLPEGAEPHLDPEKTAAMKRWAAELLKLPEDAVVLVSETRCGDPACPLVETVLGVFEDGRTRKWNFARPRHAMTRALLKFVLDSNPDGTP